MSISDLIPWNRSRREVARAEQRTPDPLNALQADLNRAFETFWQVFDAGTGDSRSTDLPRLDVRETRDAVEVKADLPGMAEEDVDLEIADGALTIRAEKTGERERDTGGYRVRERSVGLVTRVVPLPEGLDLAAAQASFRNGMVTVTIPKTEAARSATRRIPVRQS